jgi:hypothetical protein
LFQVIFEFLLENAIEMAGSLYIIQGTILAQLVRSLYVHLSTRIASTDDEHHFWLDVFLLHYCQPQFACID